MTRPSTVPHQRVSLSRRRLQHTECVIVHIVGQAKRSVLERAEKNPDPLHYPVSAFLGADGFDAGGRPSGCQLTPETGERGHSPQVLAVCVAQAATPRFCFSIVKAMVRPVSSMRFENPHSLSYQARTHQLSLNASVVLHRSCLKSGCD